MAQITDIIAAWQEVIDAWRRQTRTVDVTTIDVYAMHRAGKFDAALSWGKGPVGHRDAGVYMDTWLCECGKPFEGRIAFELHVQFSVEACKLCGFRHQLDGFALGSPVRVLANARQALPSKARIGEYGIVREWSQYCGPMFYRVQFMEGRDNFDPCELEMA